MRSLNSVNYNNDNIVGVFYEDNFIEESIIEKFDNDFISLSKSDESGSGKKMRLTYSINLSKSKDLLLQRIIKTFTDSLVLKIYNSLLSSLNDRSDGGGGGMKLKITPTVNPNNMSEFLKFIESFKDNISFEKYKEIKKGKTFLPKYLLFGINAQYIAGLYKYIYTNSIHETLFSGYSMSKNYSYYDVENMLLLNYIGANRRELPPHLMLVKESSKCLYDVKIYSVKTVYKTLGACEVTISFSYKKINSPDFNFIFSDGKLCK